MLFEGKVIASVFCENEDLSGASFDGSTIYEVTFDHCNLLKCTFRGALIKKIKFIQCGEGASFDDEPLVDENSEVTIVRTDGAGHEVYLGAEITKVAKEFGGRSVPRVKPPKDIPKQAIAIIFSSLFKADKHRLDYPEKHKIENRLRAWLSNFSLDQSQVRDLLQAFSRGLGDLKDQGWICLNPNRPRTFVPCADRRSEIGQIMRIGKVDAHLAALAKVVNVLQEACDKIVT